MEAIDKTWCTWEGVHGGYALARAAEAGIQPAEGLPRAIQGTFLAPVPPDRPFDVQTTELRRGTSTSDIRVEVAADGRRALDVLVTLDRLRDGPNFERFPAPRVQPADAYDLLALMTPEFAPFAQHVEVRAISDAGLLNGASDPELTAWVRLSNTAALQPWQAVTTILDALPPAMYAVATAEAAIPTKALSVALTDHAHQFEPGEWTLVRIRADAAAAGWVIETSAVWDRHGNLLGHANQHRQILTPLH